MNGTEPHKKRTNYEQHQIFTSVLIQFSLCVEKKEKTKQKQKIFRAVNDYSKCQTTVLQSNKQ